MEMYHTTTKPNRTSYVGNNNESVEMTPLNVPVSQLSSADDIYDNIRDQMRAAEPGSSFNINILAVFKL